MNPTMISSRPRRTVASEIVNNLDHVHVYYKAMIFTEVTEHVNVLNE